MCACVAVHVAVRACVCAARYRVARQFLRDAVLGHGQQDDTRHRKRANSLLRQWPAAFREVCQALCSPVTTFCHKLAASVVLQTLLQEHQHLSVVDAVADDDANGGAGASEEAHSGVVAEVAESLAAAVGGIYSRYSGHRRFVLASPVVRGFCQWVSAATQERFRHAVALLVRMPLWHAYEVAPSYGNVVPHQARLLIRALVSDFHGVPDEGEGGAAGTHAGEKKARPSAALFKKLLEMLTNVINTATPFIDGDGDEVLSGGAGSPSRRRHHHPRQLPASVLQAALHLLEDLFAPQIWRTVPKVAVVAPASAANEGGGANASTVDGSEEAQPLAYRQYLSSAQCFYSVRQVAGMVVVCVREHEVEAEKFSSYRSLANVRAIGP